MKLSQTITAHELYPEETQHHRLKYKKDMLSWNLLINPVRKFSGYSYFTAVSLLFDSHSLDNSMWGYVIYERFFPSYLCFGYNFINKSSFIVEWRRKESYAMGILVAFLW